MIKRRKITCKKCGKNCWSGLNRLCTTCHYSQKNAKQRTKQKIPVKRVKQLQTQGVPYVPDSTLHSLFSKCVKRLYPLKCHSCGRDLAPNHKETHACHFVGRARLQTTWDIRNVLPGCGYCNRFVEIHVFRLGVWIDHYWGVGTAIMLDQKGRTTGVKIDRIKRYELWKLFGMCLSSQIDRYEFFNRYSKIMEG